MAFLWARRRWLQSAQRPRPAIRPGGRPRREPPTNTPTDTSPPPGSRIAKRLEGADFFDAWAIDAADPDYRPGDRVGIFTLIENTPDEVMLGDSDKHLEVVLSVHCARPTGQPVRVTVTTVVHTKNRLGRLYMLPVKPMHRLISPAVLRAIGA